LAVSHLFILSLGDFATSFYFIYSSSFRGLLAKINGFGELLIED